MNYEITLTGEAAMTEFGARLAGACRSGLMIHLEGNLGAGKTTLVRGVLRGMGHQGPVRSPTYTLVEPYELQGRPVYHMDLYRLADPEELEYIGIRDMLDAASICLVEWPGQGAGILPPPELRIDIAYAGDTRRLTLSAHSPRAGALLSRLADIPDKVN